MYKKNKIVVVIPAYNEEKLIEKTITTVPDFVDYIIAINDGSTDKTDKILSTLSKKIPRLRAFTNKKNLGLGATMVRGYEEGLKTDADLFVIMAGDAQCDPDYLKGMVDELLRSGTDYVKANRFLDMEALEQMPKFRRFGNIVITMLTKFATGYYSIFDTQNSYGVIRRQTISNLSLGLIGKRYDFENTQLIAMSIANTKIKDFSVPAIYGDETSTISLGSTVYHVLAANFKGFWKRIYYKYILFGFHPIALFLFFGLLLSFFGTIMAVVMLVEKVSSDVSPTTGSVMLSVLPIILGFQLLLTALIMDVYNEAK